MNLDLKASVSLVEPVTGEAAEGVEALQIPEKKGPHAKVELIGPVTEPAEPVQERAEEIEELTQ